MTEKKEGGGGGNAGKGNGVSVLTNPFHVIISDIKHTRHLRQSEKSHIVTPKTPATNTQTKTDMISTRQRMIHRHVSQLAHHLSAPDAVGKLFSSGSFNPPPSSYASCPRWLWFLGLVGSVEVIVGLR